jgi:predicted nuclease of predicted toxin-antitoxin system
MIRFLANENVPIATVRKLQKEGFDVISISETFPSIKDEAVILFASAEHRIIITFDRDYGELIFRRGVQPPTGIIYFRIREFQPEKPAQILLDLLPIYEFEEYFTVITEKSIRQKKL